MIEMRIVDNGPMCRPEFQCRFVLFTADASGSLCPPDPDNMWSEWKTAEWVKADEILRTEKDIGRLGVDKDLKLIYDELKNLFETGIR